MKELNSRKMAIEECALSAENFAELMLLIRENKISGKIAKSVLPEILLENLDPRKYVEEQGLLLITDGVEIQRMIDKILGDNTQKVQDFRAGKSKLFGFFQGALMKESSGLVDPVISSRMLRHSLESSSAL